MFHILLPTDFSKYARDAINYAICLFKDIPCTFHLLHAHQVSPSALTSTINRERSTRLHEITLEEVTIKLQNLVSLLERNSKTKSHHFRPIMESNSLLNAVGRNVIDLDIDLICIGTQGASGLKEVFMGSNAVSIMKGINFCPILAVPAPGNFLLPAKMGFATDFKHSYKAIELAALLDLIKIWNTKLHIVHMQIDEIDEEQTDCREQLIQILEEVPFELDVIDYHPTTSYRIIKWAEEKQIDILVMLNSKKSFFRRLLHEPIIKKIAFKSHIPFLVLPEAI